MVRRAQLRRAQFHARRHAVGRRRPFLSFELPEPGIAGVAQVSKLAYPDATQFDRKSPYFDAKATRDAPRWFNVEVKFVEKTPLISLPELRASRACRPAYAEARQPPVDHAGHTRRLEVHRQARGQEGLNAVDISLVVAFVALGCLIGFLAGLLGIGGTMIMVPFLTIIFTHENFPREHLVHLAVATAMATILFTSISSMLAHHRRGAVLWRVVRRLVPGILLGSLIGPLIVSGLSSTVLASIFAVFATVASVQMLTDRVPKATRVLPGRLGVLGAGAGIGILSGMVGAGGAFVTVPFLERCNVKIHNAVRDIGSPRCRFAIAGTAGFVLSGLQQQGLPPHTLGYVYLPALVCIAASSMLLAPVGARLAHDCP